MVKVFVAETGVKFVLDTEDDLTGVTLRLIKYMKPDGTLGSWIAIDEGDPADGNISHAITLVTELDLAGRWVFWAKIVHADNSVSYGEAEGYTIYPEGL